MRGLRSFGTVRSVLRTRYRTRSLAGRLVTPVATMLVLGYFAFHAFNGQYGVRARIAFETREIELETRLAALQAVSSRMRNRVALLKEGDVEYDMLDERARRLLNVVREDEIVLLD